MFNFVSSTHFIPGLYVVLFIVGSGMTRAAVSETCQSELNTLLNNPSLAVTNGGTCDYEVSGGSLSCTFDYANITADFDKACRQTGGKPYLDDFTCAFREDVGGVTAKLDNYYQNYPFCAGASCSDAETRELFASKVIAVVEEALTSFECAVSASRPNGIRMLHLVVMVVSVVAVGVSYG